MQQEYDLIVISDLHLSEGWSEETHRISRNEDFFFDLSFRRFVEHLRAQNKKYRLVINGDFVDFLQVTSVPDMIGKEEITKREREFGLGTTHAKTIWKLKRIMNGHWVFFRALAEFLSDDWENEIYVLPGNHDIEFVMPEVQEALREGLVRYLPNNKFSEQDAIKKRVKFLPWFYYDTKYSIYIDHGCQFDALNSFDYFPCPYRPDCTIDLPAGSFFVRYLFNSVEIDHPFADNMKPVSKFMRWFVSRLYKWSYLKEAGKYIKFFKETLAKAGPVEQEWARELELRQERIIKNISDEYSLDLNKLLCIKNEWVPSAIHNNSKYELCWKFIAYSLPNNYWRKKAVKIQQALGVQFVIFGHTHESDLYEISRNPDKKNEYVNSGTWTKIFAADYEETLLKEGDELTYVHLRKEGVKTKMELLQWNEGLREGERIRLFEYKK
jgi:UDP-2,3-diacylglucosamine pyrophosphatase LpxH